MPSTLNLQSWTLIVVSEFEITSNSPVYTSLGNNGLLRISILNLKFVFNEFF